GERPAVSELGGRLSRRCSGVDDGWQLGLDLLRSGDLAAIACGAVMRAAALFLWAQLCVACLHDDSDECATGGICPPGLKCVIDDRQNQLCVVPTCGDGVVDP